MERINDVSIIGMGPAGITAAIYLKRSNITPLCFEKDKVGGVVNKITEIENYPAYLGDGKGLVELFNKQLEHFDISIINKQVISINQNDDGTFLIRTLGENYLSKAVIVASGIVQKPYKVKGSNKYSENGISRCAECDGPFSKNKPVAVYSTDVNGIKEATYLASLCSKVYFVNPNKEIAGDQKLVEEFKKLPNVEIINGAEIIDSDGTRKISSITLSSGRKLEINALFLFIGASPVSEFLGYMDVTDKIGLIKVNDLMETEVKGLFAIGDAIKTPLRQVAVAVGDGAICAVSVRNYLNSLKKNEQ